MREVGYYSLLISLIAALAVILLKLPIKILGPEERKNKLVFDLFFVQTSFNLIAFIILIYCYLVDDFSVALVALNSNITMLTFYKISAAWSSHQGSLLLWECFLTSFGFLYFYCQLKKESWRFDFLYVQSLLSAFFLILIFFTSNPFKQLYPRAVEGQGLNPILQDVALAIHPPILFAAYSGFALIYSMSVVMLRAGNIVYTKIAGVIRITFALMTFALALGSWWAYRELGWGGFWFWDPVENSALLPWLVSLALIHSMHLGNNSHDLSRKYLLGILGFIASLFATFIVRSGLLISVHSFASDSNKGVIILLATMFYIAFAAFYLIRAKQIEIKDKNKPQYFYLKVNLAIILVYFVTIAFGIMAPIFYETIYGEKITVGANYFNHISRFFAYLILLLITCANLPLVKNLKSIINIIIPLLLAAAIVLCVNEFLEIKNSGSLVLLILSCGMILGQIFLLADGKNIKMMSKKLSMHFAHFAFALLVIAITIQYEKSFDIESRVKIGEGRYYNDDFYLKLTKLDRERKDDFMLIQASFEVWHQNVQIGQLLPEIRFYPRQNIKTNEVSILRVKALNDLYATIERYDESEYLYLRLQYKPLMNLVWLSLVIMASSILWSLKKKKNDEA